MNMESGEIRHECPVCRSKKVAMVHRVVAEAAARHFLDPRRHGERFRDLCDHIASLWGQDHCFICRCVDCGFGFADPYIAGDAKFYSLAYQREPGDYPTHKWDHDIAIDTLQRCAAAHGGRSTRLLEVGAGDGAFIRRIAPSLVDPAAILCTDYGDYGTAELRKLGVRVVQGDIREIPLGVHDRFDVVCLFQVLEHLDRLPELFTRLWTITSPQPWPKPG